MLLFLHDKSNSWIRHNAPINPQGTGPGSSETRKTRRNQPTVSQSTGVRQGRSL